MATCQVYKLLEFPTVYHFSSIFTGPSQRPCPMGYTPQNLHVLVLTWQLHRGSQQRGCLDLAIEDCRHNESRQDVADKYE
jgi:hypothetical protein